jgi:hypothetical protein
MSPSGLLLRPSCLHVTGGEKGGLKSDFREGRSPIESLGHYNVSPFRLSTYSASALLIRRDADSGFYHPDTFLVPDSKILNFKLSDSVSQCTPLPFRGRSGHVEFSFPCTCMSFLWLLL